MCVWERSFGRAIWWWHVLGKESSWAWLGSSTGSLEHLPPLWPLGSSIHSEAYFPGSSMQSSPWPPSYRVSVLLRIRLVWKEKGLVQHAQEVSLPKPGVGGGKDGESYIAEGSPSEKDTS